MLGPAAAEAAAAVVVLHGRGHGGETMVPLVRALAREDVHFVIPSAANRTWYPDRFTAPTAANEPWLSYALDAVDTLVRRVADAPRLVLLGFSQGACLTCEYVARNPRRYDGVAALTGGLIGTDDELTRPASGFDGAPVLLTTSEADAWVPPERTRASAEILAAAGADVDLRIHPPGPHVPRPDEIAATRALIGG